jgi:hypothetical protein
MDEYAYLWTNSARWNVLFSCRDCGRDVLVVACCNPEEFMRCRACEVTYVHGVSDRLLGLALEDLDR